MTRTALELFSGTDSVGRVLRQLGWKIVSVDNGSEWKKGDPWGQPTHMMDVREFFRLNPGRHFNFGWASVPCHKYSVSVIGRNWNHDHTPKSQGAKEALELLRATVAYLEETCQWFLIENPRGKMRRIIEKEFPSLRRYETAWCRYRQGGALEPMKPSDLFGRMPPGFEVLPPCRNGDGCHITAPRGSQTGTQGNVLKLKGMIPELLVREIDAALTAFDSFEEGAALPAPVGVREELGAVGLGATAVEGGPLGVLAGHSGNRRFVAVADDNAVLALGQGAALGAPEQGGEGFLDELAVAGVAVDVRVAVEEGVGHVRASKRVYTPRLDNPAYTPMPNSVRSVSANQAGGET